jgi:hypothetical protein
VCSLFGVEKIEDLNDMKISTSTSFLLLERALLSSVRGRSAVGDIAYPDGDYVMDDGSQ